MLDISPIHVSVTENKMDHPAPVIGPIARHLHHQEDKDSLHAAVAE